MLGASWRSRLRYALIDVGHVGHGGFVDHRGVVIVVHDGGVDRGVCHVDVVHVVAADVIRRHVDFSRTEREPADADAGGKSAADSDTHGEVRSANPGNERGRVNGPNVNYADDNGRGARAPSPKRRRRLPSVRSGMERNPKAHHPPRCSPKARYKPSGRSDREPSRRRQRAGTRWCRTPAWDASRRIRRGLRSR